MLDIPDDSIEGFGRSLRNVGKRVGRGAKRIAKAGGRAAKGILSVMTQKGQALGPDAAPPPTTTKPPAGFSTAAILAVSAAGLLIGYAAWRFLWTSSPRRKGSRGRGRR